MLHFDRNKIHQNSRKNPKMPTGMGTSPETENKAEMASAKPNTQKRFCITFHFGHWVTPPRGYATPTLQIITTEVFPWGEEVTHNTGSHHHSLKSIHFAPGKLLNHRRQLQSHKYFPPPWPNPNSAQLHPNGHCTINQIDVFCDEFNDIVLKELGFDGISR